MDKEVNINVKQTNKNGDNVSKVDLNVDSSIKINSRLLSVVDFLAEYFNKSDKKEILTSFDDIKIGTIRKIEINKLDDSRLKDSLDHKIIRGDIALASQDLITEFKKAKFLNYINSLYFNNYKENYKEGKITGNTVISEIMTQLIDIILKSNRDIPVEDIQECVEHLVYHAFIECKLLEKEQFPY